MKRIIQSKTITLPALFLASFLASSAGVLAQDKGNVVGNAGAIADRLNPALQNYEPGQQPRLKNILIQNQAGQETRLVLDTWRKVNLFIRFTPGSHSLSSKAQKLLKEVGGALEELNEAGRKFVIIGHTDATGDKTRNKRLSRQRAMSVRGYILQNFNIRPEQLLTAGAGESDPYDTQKLDSIKNRRIEVVLVEEPGRRAGVQLSYRENVTGSKSREPNAVCDSYQGVRLRDIRPKHMEMDYYDARTPVRCISSTKRKQDRH